MKRMKLMLVFVLMAAIAFGFTEIRRFEWLTGRTLIDANDTNLTTKTYAVVKAAHSENWINIGKEYNTLEFAIRFTESDANSPFVLYALRNNGDAELAGTGTVYAGTMEATKTIDSNTSYFADKIVVSTDFWPTGLVVTCDDDTGDNQMAKLLLYTCGREKWLLLFTSISDGSMALDYSGW